MAKKKSKQVVKIDPPIKMIPAVKPTSEPDTLQRGANLERAAFRAKLQSIESDKNSHYIAGIVAHDLLEWLKGREERTDAQEGGL